MTISYFHNKNYAAIYAHNFFDTLGKSMTELFSAVILYNLGLPIHFILLFFAFQFGLMGALSPLSLVFSSRIGLNNTILLSNFSHVAGVYILVTGSVQNLPILFSSFLFFGIRGALYHPILHGVISMYVEDEHRGRFNSLNAILKVLATFFSVSIGAYFLIIEKNIFIVLATIISLAVSLLFYILFLEKKEFRQKYTFKFVYKYLFSGHFRKNIPPFAFQALLIIERILLPLFIFIYFEDLKTASNVILISVLLELLVLYLFGRRIDKFSRKSFQESFFIRSLSPVIFLLSRIHFLFIYAGQMYSRIADNIFNSSFSTQFQTKAKRVDDPILFTTCKEMALCFSELFFLLGLSLVSVSVKEQIFSLIFIGSFVSTWIIYKVWRD